MKPQKTIHWVTPTTMVAAFLVGCMLSLGHHLFYSSLAGTNTPTGYYHAIAGNKISKQELNTAIGTTFAFLVKAMLALAVSTAYVQAFWHSAKASKRGQRLSTLETTFPILGNVLGFAKVHVWVKHPLLLFLVIIAWSAPIASIVTPATLSVQYIAVQQSKLTPVPKFGFTNYDFVAPLEVDVSSGTDYSELDKNRGA
ncbi:uncharacterized protein M437DRAFT_64181 [Aureobasidium melanogenum CBS 110374]|uniref:Uncharacterized protein n=1 Tax=Aureobasidium melanogenum (strain CBS 110374) TaxID=1043003 RepID=A0A074WQ03_AURM1|nr:uncharacterized protein M437DRAFT_64181 [Aureobasidium melanogenum CBS 110374]KEQ64531.1 hypothetical protein M437DRAFT_64181 [Aureobasidium melanogenum CBS 110374]